VREAPAPQCSEQWAACSGAFEGTSPPQKNRYFRGGPSSTPRVLRARASGQTPASERGCGVAARLWIALPRRRPPLLSPACGSTRAANVSRCRCCARCCRFRVARFLLCALLSTCRGAHGAHLCFLSRQAAPHLLSGVVRAAVRFIPVCANSSQANLRLIRGLLGGGSFVLQRWRFEYLPEDRAESQLPPPAREGCLAPVHEIRAPLRRFRCTAFCLSLQ